MMKPDGRTLLNRSRAIVSYYSAYVAYSSTGTEDRKIAVDRAVDAAYASGVTDEELIAVRDHALATYRSPEGTATSGT